MDRMVKTEGLPPDAILYGGSKEELQRKLRARDDRITELEAEKRIMANALSKIATLRIRIQGSAASPEIHEQAMRDVASTALNEIGIIVRSSY